MLADESIGKEEFDIANDSLKRELRNLEINMLELSDYKKDLDYYVSFGLSLMINLDKIYENCGIELKKKLCPSEEH